MRDGCVQRALCFHRANASASHLRAHALLDSVQLLSVLAIKLPRDFVSFALDVSTQEAATSPSTIRIKCAQARSGCLADARRASFRSMTASGSLAPRSEGRTRLICI